MASENQLDERKPYATLVGTSSAVPGARFRQGGKYFDRYGNEVSGAPATQKAEPRRPGMTRAQKQRHAERVRRHESEKDKIGRVLEPGAAMPRKRAVGRVRPERAPE